MDRNRRIVLIILVLVALSCILAIIDIGLNMQATERSAIRFTSPDFNTADGVGIVKLYGPIQISDSSESLFGLTTGADAVVKRLDGLLSDNKIKAVVLRINSPGGTIAATQEIFAKLMELRKNNKVIVASMGDVAASGGYYVASACNYILCNHGTITGSIGVIAATPNLKGLFEKLGIKMNVIKSGKYKDILSAYRETTSDELQLVQEMIDSSYNQFLKDVSLGRNLSISDIKDHADGRVMSGETALRAKLVDGIGTYEDAVMKAKEMAGLDKGCPIYDDVSSPFQQILMSIEGKFNSKDMIGKISGKSYTMLEYSIE